MSFTQMPYNREIAVSKTILDSSMASDPDAPYKSRLFNFLNRQSILWNDRWERTYRYARVAATGGHRFYSTQFIWWYKLGN